MGGCGPYQAPVATRPAPARQDATCVDCDGDDNVPFFDDADATAGDGRSDDGEREWTVMIYFATHVGNEPELAQAVADNLRAIRSVGAGPYANVIVQYHRPETGRVAGVEDVRLRLPDAPPASPSPDDVTDGFEPLGTLGDADQGDPQTLADFVRFATTHYPARRYALILHGHGLAWEGFGHDANHAQHHMTPTQIADALGAALPDRRLDLIMFDACLMGTVEVAAELRDRARYFLASETLEVAAGQPYAALLPWLTQHPSLPTEHVVADLAHAYVMYYSIRHGYDGPPPPTALTAVGLDLDAIDGLSAALGRVADGLRRASGGLTSREVSTILADKEMAIADDGIHSADLVQVLSGLEAASFTDAATKQAAHDALALIGYPDDGYSAAERSVIVRADAPSLALFAENGWTRNDDVTGAKPPLVPAYDAQAFGAPSADGFQVPAIALAPDPGDPSSYVYTFRPFIPNVVELDWVLGDSDGTHATSAPQSVAHERDYYLTQSFRARSPSSPFIVEAHTQGYYFRMSEMVHGLGVFFGTVLPQLTAYRAGRFAAQSGWACVFKSLISCPQP